jgi:hypothetical protein
MRLFGVALAALVAASGCFGHRAAPPAATARPDTESTGQVRASAPVTTAAPVAADGFTTTVRPILAQACAPCHDPGGKMYDKLPFDEPKVVREHEKGVRKRLKGENLEVFERWLTTPVEK